MDHKKPDGMHRRQLKTKMLRPEQEWQIRIDNIFFTVVHCKKDDDVEQPDKVEMADIVKNGTLPYTPSTRLNRPQVRSSKASATRAGPMVMQV